MEPPAGAADDVRERHRQIGLPLRALVLVLLEDDRVELGAALVERVEALAETGDVLAWCERQGESHAMDALAVVKHA